jgi:hypothetical protein
MNASTPPPSTRFPSEREAGNHPERRNRARVPILLRRLAAPRTTRPDNAEPSGLRRRMGTLA